MAQNNVLPLRQNTKTPKQIRQTVRASPRQFAGKPEPPSRSASPVTLTALSLSHLAHGVEIVTGSSTWESWAMAIGTKSEPNKNGLSPLSNRTN
jgi:hypothetical protein